jgi:hypothetical protein
MLTHFLVPIFKISPHSIKCIQFGELWKFLFLVMTTILEDSFRNGATNNLSPIRQKDKQRSTKHAHKTKDRVT